MRKETCRRLPDAHGRIALSWFFRGFLVFSLVAIGRGQQTPSPRQGHRSGGKHRADRLHHPSRFRKPSDGVALHYGLLLRVAPNQKDLKNATKINAGEISVGDRILVRGRISDDQKTLFAAAAIVMSKADITRKQEAERADWQKRGVGGLVSSFDPATSTITISTGGAVKKVVIHMSKDTVLRRYAADSVRFDDARPAKLDEIKAGGINFARAARAVRTAVSLLRRRSFRDHFET